MVIKCQGNYQLCTQIVLELGRKLIYEPPKNYPICWISSSPDYWSLQRLQGPNVAGYNMDHSRSDFSINFPPAGTSHQGSESKEEDHPIMCPYFTGNR